MQLSNTKSRLKDLLGGVPLAAELDWRLRHRREAVGGFNLEQLERALPDWAAQAAASPYRNQKGKKIFLFATLRYWIEQASLLALGFAGLGHQVTLAFLPYADWDKKRDAFAVRQHNLYAKKVLGQTGDLLNIVSLLDIDASSQTPEEMRNAVEAVSVRDYQFTRQVEEVDQGSALYKLRFKRNRVAAASGLYWLQQNQPDVVVMPNGLILEFGALYQAARHLNIPVMSYEFGEQRDRVWFSQNAPVMVQDTREMWAARGALDFDDDKFERIKALFASRQGADLYENFHRRWQDLPAEGADKVRAKLGLDSRPLVLLAANVIGDSLTLGRQVFTETMTEWLQRTAAHFSDRRDVQFVIRVHPGERYLSGPSVADIVREALPDMPEHVRLIGFDDPINTYDLMAIADLGLVYTTTVGMEMAMSGVPVIVLGNTHYREKGFTLDPSSWDEYFGMLDNTLKASGSKRLSEQRVRRAWHYAYRFFFDYPRPFPWHLLHFWDDVQTRPLASVLTEEGMSKYGAAFDYLAGEPVNWAALD